VSFLRCDFFCHRPQTSFFLFGPLFLFPLLDLKTAPPRWRVNVLSKPAKRTFSVTPQPSFFLLTLLVLFRPQHPCHPSRLVLHPLGVGFTTLLLLCGNSLFLMFSPPPKTPKFFFFFSLPIGAFLDCKFSLKNNLFVFRFFCSFIGRI